LLPQHKCLLHGYGAGAIDHVRPAVPQVTQLSDLTPVVSAHVSPPLGRPVVSEAAVELDVYAVRLDEDVEVLRSVTSSRRLSSPEWETMAAPELGVTELERRLSAGSHIR
jgi:hypothetical protein